MPFNGSGTYTLPAGNPVVSGSIISSVTHNATNSDIASALSDCITKDGQSTVTANIPFNAHKITGLAPGTTAGDSVHYEQVVLLSGVNTMAADLPMGGFKLTGLAAGTTAGDSVQYEQVPILVAGAAPVSQGGTGSTSLTDKSLLVGRGTDAVAAITNGAFGLVLTSNGVDAEPTFQDFPPTLGSPSFLLMNAGII